MTSIVHGCRSVAATLCRSWRRASASRRSKISDAVLHDCRHTFASLLISQGRDVVFVAAQLGDTVETTLRTYAWLFDVGKQMDTARSQLSAEYGHLLSAEAAIS